MTAVLSQSRLVEEVDHVHDECLLVQRIGVTGVGILIAGALRKLTAGKFPALTGA